MTSNNEELVKQLEIEARKKLEQVAKLLSMKDAGKLHQELDNRIFLSNESFLREVKNISLIAVTAAPFSLALLLSGLNIEKTYLVIAFVFFMIDVLFLNIGVWYLNSQFRKSTASQKLEAISIDVETSKILDEKKENAERFDSLYELIQAESRLGKKKMMEPYSQDKILNSLRNCGLLFLSVAITFLILSVILSIF